jgi:hypothetical protein
VGDNVVTVDPGVLGKASNQGRVLSWVIESNALLQMIASRKKISQVEQDGPRRCVRADAACRIV